MIFEVTQEHISFANPLSSGRWAIALALRDAGAQDITLVNISSVIITHELYGWDERRFLCSNELEEWQKKSIPFSNNEPIKIEFDERLDIVSIKH